MAYVGKITGTNGTTGLVGSTLYGTCATAANTAAKVVTLAEFDTLITGVTVHVKMTNSNTATDPTLNVNSTGAKSICRNGTTKVGNTEGTSWVAGAVLSFTYDGTNWVMNDSCSFPLAHTHPDQDIKWGTVNLTGSYNFLDGLMNQFLSPNRFAGAKAAGITIEYSNDAGSTWTTYPNLTATQKSNIFTNRATVVRIGGPSSVTPTVSANSQLRITLNTSTAQIYTNINKIHIYISTSYSQNCKVTIKAATHGDPTNFSKIICNNHPISGWSGWNVVASNFTTYGNTDAQYQYIQFTFTHTGTTAGKEANGLQVMSIMGFGGVGWTCPSSLAQSGHVYSFDGLMCTTFPNKLTISSGGLSVTGAATFSDTVQVAKIKAPTTAGGTTYDVGTSGQFIRSNGTSSYWGSLAAADIPALNYVPNTQAGMNAAINLLGVGTSNPQLGDYYVAQYAGGGTTTTSYHRRPVSALWNTFKELITAETTGSGNAITAVSIANDGNNRKITFTKGTTFPTTDEKVKITLASTADTRYYFGLANTDGTKTLNYLSGTSVYYTAGTVDSEGHQAILPINTLTLGMGQYDNMEEGNIYLYGYRQTRILLKPATNGTTNTSYTLTLPMETGTVCLTNHTHSYAGSSSAGGAATSANKLNTNDGSATKPVYFSGGVPVAVTQPASGAWWSAVPLIDSSGVLEIGRYIDFHATAASTNNYDIRLDASSTSLITLSGKSGNAIMRIAGTEPTIRFQQTTSGNEYDGARIWSLPAGTNGSQLFIQSGGITMIGAGEFCTNALARKDANNQTVVGFDNIVTTNATTEKLYIGSDDDVKIITNGQNIGTYNNNDHKVWHFETTGQLLTPGEIKDSLSSQHTMIEQSVRSSGNSVVLAKWVVDGAASATYLPQISFYNMGGDATDKGAITLLPYHCNNSSPWGGSIGLYIGKNILKLDGKNVLHTGNTSVSTSTVSGATTIKSIKINNTNYNICDSSSTLYFTTAGTKWGRVASLVTTKQSTYVMLLSVSQGMLAETSSSHNKGAGILQIACNTSAAGTVGSNNTAAMWLVAGGNISAANFVLIGYNNSKYASDGKTITSQSGSAVFELWVKNTANYHIWCIKTLQELYAQNVGSYFTFYNLTDSDAKDNRPTTGSVTKTSTFMIPVTS